MTGIGLYTNGINPRAVAAKWMAGRDSMMDDVRFLGGHGTIDPNATAEESSKAWEKIYNNTHTADSDLDRRWDGQYPSLWITGGGTFVDIWTPSTFAQAGLYISDTSTEGRIYELSSEHHVRNEVVLHNASNWQIYALQTEEERGESGFALPLEIRDSSNITIANLHMYRVVSSYQPFPYAIKVANSQNIRFRNVHCYSDSKVSFDNAVYDQTHNAGGTATRIRLADDFRRRAASPPQRRLLPFSPRAPRWREWRLVSSIFPEERLTAPGTFISSTPNGKPSTAGQPQLASYRRSAIIRWIRFNWSLIRPAT